MPNNKIDRRSFFQSGALATGAIVAGSAANCSATSIAIDSAPKNLISEVDGADVNLKGRIYKTLKNGMVRVPGDLTKKFEAAKEAGFDGIELGFPDKNLKVEAVLKAIKESKLPVDGTVCSTHWGVRHTDPNPAVRAKALKDLKSTIEFTHGVGGNTALLVVGHGKDGKEEDIWKLAIENISKALPLCARLGVYIAIENVWNQFHYDHGGDENQSAEKFVKFVDELNSPWVGMQFDIGNHWKYGNVADWIRQLGKRVVKLDLKGFSRKSGRFTKIGEGDIDWADVRKALSEINYYGWAAAEVGGGDLNRLKEVSANMDRVFALK